MAAREVPKSRGGMERCPFLGYWTLQSTFVKKVFDLSNPFMRKGKEREKMGKPQTVIYTKQLDHRAEVHSAVELHFLQRFSQGHNGYFILIWML